MKKIIAWCVVHPKSHGSVFYYTDFYRTKREAIYQACAWASMNSMGELAQHWKEKYSKGYRCIQVEIKEIEKGKK